MADNLLRFAHKILQVQQAAGELFVIVFLVCASVFCPSSYAQDAPGPSAGEQSAASVPAESARQEILAPPVNPQAESAGDEDLNQDGGQTVPFSASIENSEFGTVTVSGRLVVSNDAGERTLEITEVKWDSVIFAEQITKLKEAMLTPALVLAVLAIVSLALGILSFVFGAKKKNFAKLNDAIDKMKEDHAEHYKELKELKELKEGLNAAQPEQGGYLASRADVCNIETRIIEALKQNLCGVAKTEEVDKLSDHVNVLEDEKRTREGIKKGALDPLDVFNSWAANPERPLLPEAFCYLQGDFRIRENHTLTESANPSKWISNRYGMEKYLLPNPGFFDDMTNISELYAMDRTRLKAKGQNRIRVKDPCRMEDNGYINYPGELQLL